MTDTAVSPSSGSSIFYGYVVAGYSFAILFLASSFFLHSRGIFFPMWMADFNVDRTEISLVITLTLFTGNCIAPLMGYLIDRFPARLITMIGASWMATGYITYQFIDSYYGFFACLLIFQSIGWVSVGPLVHTKLMVNWFSRNRGIALGVAIMGVSVAGIVMPTTATILAENLGWRGSYSVYAGVLLLVFLPLTLLLVKQEPGDIGQFPDGDPAPPAIIGTSGSSVEGDNRGFEVYKEFLSSKSFWSVVITFTLMNGVYSAMITHLPTYLTMELSFDMFDASYVLGVAGGAAITGKIVFGWLMDHWNAKATVLLGVGAYLVSTVIFMTAVDYAVILVAAGFFGFAFGGMVPVRSVLLSRIFGGKKFSRANGLFSFFLAPATFWVLATGYLADATGTYVTAFQVWAVAFTLAGIVTIVIRLPNQQDSV